MGTAARRIFATAVAMVALGLSAPGAAARAPVPTPSGAAEEQLQRIERGVEELSRKRKDAWDRLASISVLVSGAMVATIGAIATYVVNSRQRQAQTQDL